MKILLVDLSHYPYAYFPQLKKGMDIDEYKNIPGEFEKVYTATFFETFYSFPDENLWGYDSVEDLLEAFCRKLGYDYFEKV